MFLTISGELLVTTKLITYLPLVVQQTSSGDWYSLLATEYDYTVISSTHDMCVLLQRMRLGFVVLGYLIAHMYM